MKSNRLLYFRILQLMIRISLIYLTSALLIQVFQLQFGKRNSLSHYPQPPRSHFTR